MTRTQHESLADQWSKTYATTRSYHALEKAKHHRTQALKMGASRKCKRKIRGKL